MIPRRIFLLDEVFNANFALTPLTPFYGYLAPVVSVGKRNAVYVGKDNRCSINRDNSVSIGKDNTIEIRASNATNLAR